MLGTCASPISREQYAHVLGSFSHKSYPKAKELCLAAYDELGRTGLEGFVKAHDPYWDIPLVESLPKPVINLPGLSATGTGEPGASGASAEPVLDRTGQASLGARTERAQTSARR